MNQLTLSKGVKTTTNQIFLHRQWLAGRLVAGSGGLGSAAPALLAERCSGLERGAGVLQVAEWHGLG